MGGYTPVYHKVGKEIADATYNFLDGETGNETGVVPVPGNYVFDVKRMHQFGLDSINLPKGAELVNKTPGFYEQYKYWVIGVVAAFMFLIACFLIAVYYIVRINHLKDNLEKSGEELLVAKEKAEEANRLKTAFLANMSHEIRTPLNAIVGFSNIIAEIDDEVERQSYLDIIHKNNDLLLQLIDDILDFSKIEAGTMDYHFEEVDIKDICGEIALADSIKMPSDVVLIFDLGSPSVIVKTDERRVMQVISNFVNNAIKFTTKGSITIYYEIEGDFIRVCVKDTGIGISAENQRRIFERFIKVDTFQQGTGLGLTISRTIIEALGGKIGVDSEEGVGSTFWFTLPLDTKRTDIELSPDIPVQSEETPRSDRHHSILIAEDVYENYFLLETLFGKQYQLYHALNGQEAIDMFETYHPDLILMDIKMPVMDGLELIEKIREQDQSTRIVLLTCYEIGRAHV